MHVEIAPSWRDDDRVRLHGSNHLCYVLRSYRDYSIEFHPANDSKRGLRRCTQSNYPRQYERRSTPRSASTTQHVGRWKRSDGYGYVRCPIRHGEHIGTNQLEFLGCHTFLAGNQRYQFLQAIERNAVINVRNVWHGCLFLVAVNAWNTQGATDLISTTFRYQERNGTRQPATLAWT
jgi:hypothetical protein